MTLLPGPACREVLRGSKSPLSIRPFALSGAFAPALTSAFTRVEDDLEVAAPRGTSMPTYVSLIHWTDQGIKNYKDTTSRAADVTRLVESAGGRFHELLWTVGEYDAVAVLDFPDEETAVATVLQVGSAGFFRSNTMRAFTADEIGAIISRAG